MKTKKNNSATRRSRLERLGRASAKTRVGPVARLTSLRLSGRVQVIFIHSSTTATEEPNRRRKVFHANQAHPQENADSHIHQDVRSVKNIRQIHIQTIYLRAHVRGLPEIQDDPPEIESLREGAPQQWGD
ncbi:hypothetical protein EVAR_66405_1 [Eumeta japonica]|uniref:Uncharacterized protein n=1 Tax=Eumeta variegata TaxID=151549 RepID=A0A4C2A7N0_EUMVA|nr:hypothetical protein EVAR_66405_1 [Eumeta japonica]